MLVTVSIPVTTTVYVDDDDTDRAMDTAEAYMRAALAEAEVALRRHADGVVFGTVEALECEED